ncbi:MAG: zinc ribbon domain-containing protein [Promethearchaeota archaeon]
MIFQEYMPYGFTLGTFLPGIFVFVIRIIIAVIIAKDAQKRQIGPTLYIVLVCCAGGCIGGIVYLVIASNHPVQNGDFQEPSFSSNQGQQTIYGQQPQPIYGQPKYQQPTQPTQPTQQSQPKPVYPDASTTMPNVNKTFCPICGSQNQKNAMYCSHCGADLK